jgi:GGDEF domain-containing protein
MLDIDHFKGFNDTFGHTRGDEVLRAVSQRLREQTRNADIVTRYGGEEFVVILPMTTKPHARLVAEKLRAAIAAAVIAGAGPDGERRRVDLPRGLLHGDRAPAGGRRRPLCRQGPGPKPRGGVQRDLDLDVNPSAPGAR